MKTHLIQEVLKVYQQFKYTTFLGTNISFSPGTFQDDFPIPQVGYVSSLEGNHEKSIHHFQIPQVCRTATWTKTPPVDNNEALDAF